jgi:hypothetical protein
VLERRAIEVYAAFIKLTGEVEVGPSERVSDALNRQGAYLSLLGARTEPLFTNHPVLSRPEERASVARAAVSLVCPLDQRSDVRRSLWREKLRSAVAINTEAFSMVGDIHLDPRATLQDHLERYRGDFLPVSNLSALWVTGAAETHSLQRSFALVNPAAILSFAMR